MKPVRVQRRWLAAVWLGAAAWLAACSGGLGATATQPPATATEPARASTDPAPASPAATQAVAAATSAPTAGGIEQYVLVVAEGTEARYRVREQLAELSLPNDAVGATSAVTGQIVIYSDGAIATGESRFVVDLSTLRSDRGQRDNFLRRNTLQTSQYPTAVFVPAEAHGLPAPLPQSGSVTFQLAGDLTIRDVTRPVTWDVTAEIVEGRALVGQAVTRFTFDDFSLTQPRVPVALSVEDTITLEMDFRLERAG